MLYYNFIIPVYNNYDVHVIANTKYDQVIQVVIEIQCQVQSNGKSNDDTSAPLTCF